MATIARRAEAELSVINLPMCNMYLQGDGAGRTPRWRGITMMHEFRAAGVPVSFASDNCRDPFYAYGDYDMMEVYREAVRIAQLDHPFGDWAASVAATPAAACGFADLSRDSRFRQRIAHALTVEIGDRLTDSLVECGGVGEGLMGEVKCLKIVPDDLDGV
jgi:Amidohydrolase family